MRAAALKAAALAVAAGVVLLPALTRAGRTHSSALTPIPPCDAQRLPAVGSFGLRSSPDSTAADNLTGARGRWHVEYDPGSCADIGAADTRSLLVLRFALRPGSATTQFAAAVAAADRLEAFRTLLVTAEASRPVRIAIQLRRRDDRGASRWRRTMFVDELRRTATFDLDDFRPVAPETVPRPPLAEIAGLMLGVDTINTRPGTTGIIVLDRVGLIR